MDLALRLTPKEALVLLSSIAQSFQVSPIDGVALSTNASFAGGYAESLAGTLFTDPSLTTANDIWKQATGYKTSGLNDAQKKNCRLNSAFAESRQDIVDLYVPSGEFANGRWKAGLTPENTSADLIRLSVGAEGQSNFLTCQVKMRTSDNIDNNLDVIKYSVFLDTRQPLTRDEIIDELRCDSSASVWRTDAPDLVVACLLNGKTGVISARLATLREIQLAIIAKTVWEKSINRDVGKKFGWSGTKIDVQQFFGGKNYQEASDLNVLEQKQMTAKGWSKWAIGIDVSHVLDAIPPLVLSVTV